MKDQMTPVARIGFAGQTTVEHRLRKTVEWSESYRFAGRRA
jgi:hypothetical protein